MMLRSLVGLVIIVVITGLVASFLRGQDGNTVIEWMGWRIEARTSLLVAVAVGLIILIVAFDRLVGAVIGLPERISGRIAARRRDQGHHALALGLIAAAAGDGREAKRQGKKATRLMGASTLTDLLSAQAAGLNGDHAAAAQFFEHLSAQRETAFFGNAGLMRLHAEEGRDDDAIDAGRAAFALNGRAPHLAKALFALEAQHEHWDEAIAALHAARTDEAMSSYDAQRMLAILYFKKAEAAADDSMQDMPIKALVAALDADAGFTPAVMAAHEAYLNSGKTRKAVQVLERGMAAMPHPLIIKALYSIWSIDDAAGALAKIIRLIDKHSNDHDCLIAAAHIAMRIELWGEALRLINIIPEEERSISAWQILTDLADHAPEGVAKTAWPDRNTTLIQATTAKRAAGWRCGSCHTEHHDWQAKCTSCDSFATVDWRV